MRHKDFEIEVCSHIRVESRFYLQVLLPSRLQSRRGGFVS
jgi:hypothetical protein